MTSEYDVEAHEDLYQLCAKLRGLGATKVTLGDFSAEFTPVSGTAVVPVAGRQRHEERPLTAEQANEERRRRELGL